MIERHQKIISEEQSFVDRIRQAVRDEALRRRDEKSGNYARGIQELREAASTARAHDLPALFDQLNASQALWAREREKNQKPLPDLRAPYFAHLIVEEDTSGDKQSCVIQKDILIGHDTLVDSIHGITLLDWKTAPLAQIFYLYREGESYELELGGDSFRRGRVIARRKLVFQMGSVLEIEWDEGRLIRHDINSSDWNFVPHDQQPSLQGGSERSIRKWTSANMTLRDLAPLFDREQWQIIQSAPSSSLTVLGAAGSGKTTVALARMAFLFAQDPQFFAQHRMLVLVPEPGLARLTRRLLQSMDLERVVVGTFDEWIHKQASQVFPDCDRDLCTLTPANVVRFKRHPSIKKTWPILAERKWERMRKHLSKMVHADVLDVFDQTKEARLSRKIQEFLQHSETKVSREKHREIKRLLEAQLYDIGADRLEIWQDEKLLEMVVESSAGELDRKMVKDVMQHHRDQLFPPEDWGSKSIDAGYAKTLDDMDITTEEAEEDIVYQTIDAEDLTIMVELLFYFTDGLAVTDDKGHTREFHQYAHVILDEAQELAPIEIGMVKRMLVPGASLTLAGDDAQKTSFQNEQHLDWDKVGEDFGISQLVNVKLKASYRCPQSVIDFAYEVLGSAGGRYAEKPKSLKAGTSVIFRRVSSDGHTASLLIEELEHLTKNEPLASIAIIAADFDSAKTFAKGLRSLPKLRLVQHGAFSFEPGIDIADASQVKGLEFDYVIIPDADIYRYPDTPHHRRLMHVAATRAIHQLWVLAPLNPSRLLPSFN